MSKVFEDAKPLLVGVITLAVLVLGVMLFMPKAKATFAWSNWSPCMRGNQFRFCLLQGSGSSCSPLGNIQTRDCGQPLPTPTQVPPTPTPVPPTPTPTETPKEECEEGYHEVYVGYEQEVEVTECVPDEQPTPTPIVPTPTFSQPGSGGAPVCTDLSTILLPANFHVIRNGSFATLKWWPTQGAQVNVYYREVGQSGWQHALADQPNNGELLIGALNPSLGYEFGLQQKQGCGGGQLATAVVVDPPAHGQIFWFSYWTW